MSQEFNDFEEILDDSDKELLNNQEFDENYDDVLVLTEYDGGGLANNNLNIVAEYTNIDIVTVEKKHKAFATSFVQKISKFIIDFTLKSFIGFDKSVFNTNFLPSDKKSKSLYVYNNFP